MTGDMLLSGYLAAGGSLTGDPLEEASRECWRLLLSQTRGRIRAVDERTPEGCLCQECFNALMDAGAETAGGTLASETLGQWTRTYRDGDKSRDKALLSILRDYLGETGLLYRGWCG